MWVRASALTRYNDRMRSLWAAALLTAFALPSGRAVELTATDVARRVEDRDTGRDSRATLRMTLFDRHGRARERRLTLATLSPKDDSDRRLIRFTYPNDIRGTAFLVWEHADAEDERFLYLPSLGRVRRVAGSEAQESFVGSDFTYEDVGGREFDDYTYAFAGPDGGNASWTSADGASHPAWRLESRRRDASAEFPRVVSLVLKDRFVVVRAEIYNRRNERQKEYTVRALRQIEGIWTVMDSLMADEIERTRTALVIDDIDYNVGLTDADFSRRELQR